MWHHQNRFSVAVGSVFLLYILFYLHDWSRSSANAVNNVEDAGPRLLDESMDTSEDDHDMPAKPDASNVAHLTESVPDVTSLSKLCSKTTWTEGLWLHCHSFCGENNTSICGGLNNARNRVQTCLRLAIDAGAGIIIPSATTRDEENLLKTDSKTVCADMFWNMDYLQHAMGGQCPQLEIRMCDDRRGIKRVIETPRRSYLDAAHKNTTFRQFVDAAMEANMTSRAEITVTNPAIINFGDSYIGWNYREAGELTTIRKDLFKVIRFNQHLLDLSSSISKSPELQQGAFIGVHLRGESDWPADFGTVTDQMNLYLEEMEVIRKSAEYPMNTVYISCGDQSAIQTFRDKLSPLGYEVYDKWILLAKKPEILAQVEALAFDQKGIVEYQNLVQARFWVGVVTSSMSSLVAYARTVDDEEDYFSTYVFPGSVKSGLNRNYQVSPSMKGSETTKLMVINGVDIMDAFP